MKLYNKRDFKFNLIVSCIMSIITSLTPVIIRIIKYAHLNESGVWAWLGLFVYWIILFLISIIVFYIIIFLIIILYNRYKGGTQK
ncbi:MAG TPA: hypothetical protein DCR62_04495 [Acholeplasmatales bacterium]|nr:unknown [Staphylococcus sp. CAG:324]HAR57984.1 hypothetical protein [Acholeplasmatales bacterium]